MGNTAEKFSSTGPVGEDIQDDLDVVASQFSDFAEMLDSILPEGREKSLVITKMEEAFAWANLSVTRNA